MSEIDFACPFCGGAMTIASSAAGFQVDCIGCGRPVLVPAAGVPIVRRAAARPIRRQGLSPWAGAGVLLVGLAVAWAVVMFWGVPGLVLYVLVVAGIAMVRRR